MAIAANPGLAERADALLPQTQCRRCGYDGCRPYADAIAGGAAINRCPPGGDALVAALAALTGRAVAPLDPVCGAAGPLEVARIDEAWCIGCTLCIAACPVDAIVGAAKRMHAVLPALCTGCALCLPPCPVDCIDMVAAGRAWSPADAGGARLRFAAREARTRGEGVRKQKDAAASPVVPSKADAIAAAFVRARARRAAAGTRGRTP
ncbi:MAG TPA: RnfABCDGE type electron transport complex subunit B [Casimicrobiaceae bacterium]|nr:RnfABCDGE type electron transport complex subunit B [Casimicrobiaceae bacterium]